MIQIGQYNELTVNKELAFGLILDDGKEGILLPKRFVPKNAKKGDRLKVFLYHDGEDRIIATTQHPLGILGDIVKLRAVNITPQGAFLDWGLMKDLFVPKSKQLTGMRTNGDYLVKIYLDEQTGRLAATEKIEPFLSNIGLTVKEKDLVDLTVYRRTDIGYVVIINNRHTGVLHFNEIFRDIQPGDRFQGFIKKISPGPEEDPADMRIDVVAGRPGYERVEDATEKVLRLLKENDGYLPYHDKSDPEEIYSFFGMSKKTFKMTTGALYKQRRISFTKTGFKLEETGTTGRPEAPREAETSATPEGPRTPKASEEPETPKTPETPKIKETPKKNETSGPSKTAPHE
ncbi:MAG: S1-like domain-containing RNA-binding protein [Puia sp.]|nr:S1-like domain-containing RNA-binding protein [Puia sp.]